MLNEFFYNTTGDTPGPGPEPEAYVINRSLRFNSEDSAYLTRTPTELGNRRTWTLSTWVKRNKIGTNQCLFGTNNSWVTLSFNTDDQIDVYFQSGATSNYLKSNAVYRDPSAWYHIVLMFDTTQAVASDRVKCYVNGEELTWSRADYPAVNFETGVNALVVHDIGARSSENVIYLDAQLAEMYLIDGEALTADSFGAYDSDGVWQPKEYTIDKGINYSNDLTLDGTLFGGSSLSNAFNGDTASSAVMINLSNNQFFTFTPSTAIPYSSSVEVFLTPTGDVGATRYTVNGSGNQSFAPGDGWKTILTGSGELTSFVLKQGAQGNSVGFSAIRIDGTTILVDAPGSNSFYLDFNDTSSNGALGYDKSEIVSTRAQSAFNVVEYAGNGGTQSIESVGFQPDFLWIKAKDSAYNHRAFDSIRGTEGLYPDLASNEAANSVNENLISYDSSGFTVGPTGGVNALNNSGTNYVAWCWKAGGVAEIISPGEANSSVYNQSQEWSDSGSSTGIALGTTVAEAFDGSLTGFFAVSNGNYGLFNFTDLSVTTSLRINAYGRLDGGPIVVNEGLADEVSIEMDNSNAQKWYTIPFTGNLQTIKFTAEDDYNSVYAIEVDGRVLVDASKTNLTSIPSIKSEVSADTDYGFSVATYEGTGSVGGTVAHGLEATPEFIIVKKRSSGDASWYVYHSELDAGKALNLNNTDPQFTPGQAGITAVSETTFTLSSERDEVNGSGKDYVAYSWAEVPGFSKFGKYTGSTGTVKVTTGFKPKYVLIKCISDGGQEWIIKDSVRGGDKTLIANTSGTQTTDRNVVFNADGFSPVADQGPTNFDGRTYVYAAFAESVGNNWEVINLVAHAIGDPKANRNMDVLTYTGNGSEITVSGLSFQPSLVWIKDRSQSAPHTLFDSVRGANERLMCSTADAESTRTGGVTAFNSDGFTHGNDGAGNTNGDAFVAWCWKAGDETTSNTDGTIASRVSANPEYGFSIVTYTGNGTASTVGHGLNSNPEFYVVKNRDANGGWETYHAAYGAEFYGKLNGTDEFTTSGSTARWNDTEPTEKVFSVGTSANVNSNNAKYVAYCWSEVPGYSKIGSYTGTGNAGNAVKTGFKPRFVMVKRTTNISGDYMGWAMVDSARGGDRKVQAQNPAAENDGPINSASPADDFSFQADGFTLESGNAATNNNGETYIFIAFAGIPEGEDVDSLIDTPTNYESEIVPVEVDVPGFAAVTYAGTNSDQDIKIGFQPDLIWIKDRDAGSWHIWTDSVRGTDRQIYSNSTAVEGVNTDRITSFNSDGFSLTSNASGGVNGTGVNYVAWCWKAGNTTQTIAAGDSNSSAYNQSEIWSNASAADSRAFDGSKAYDSNAVRLFGTGTYFKIVDTANTFTNVTSVVVGTSEISNLKLDGVAYTTTYTSGIGLTVDNPPESFSEIEVQGKSSGLQISYVQINGILLVDTNATPPNINSVDSQVSVSPKYGFSVITAVQPGTSNLGCTLAHGLEKAPSMYIVKDRDLGVGWGVYHSGLDDPANEALSLNSDGQTIAGGYWRGESPTSSVLSVDTSIVGEGDDFVVYAWSEIEGFSKFGSYEGNGQVNGPVIETGFKPAFILLKDAVRSSKRWIIWDTSRDPSGNLDKGLSPNLADAEVTGFQGVVLENGFQITDEESTLNQAGDTYIYAAFGKGFTEIVDTQPDNNGGNYATLNAVDKNSAAGLTNGNLDFYNAATSHKLARATFGITYGKWYFEVTIPSDAISASNICVGVCTSAHTLSNYVGAESTGWGLLGNGNTQHGPGTAYTTALEKGDVIGVALDADAGTISWSINGIFPNPGTPTYSDLSPINGPYFPAVSVYQSGAVCNFGARPFAYAPPAGYKSLCTTNLSEPTIADGSTAMDAVTYVGNATDRSITGLSFSPSFVWIKDRSVNNDHNLYDEVRGPNKKLVSNTSNAEFTLANVFNSFDDNGFSIGGDSGQINGDGNAYVAWSWSAGNETETIAPGGANAAVYQMSAIWSDHLTAGGSVKKATDAFDGVISSRTEGNSGLTLTPPGGLQVHSSVEVIDSNSITHSQATINGVAQPFVQHSTNNWVTIFTGSGTLDSIHTLRTDNPSYDAGFTGVRVDGRELVNTDINPPVGYPSISSEVRANPAAGFSIIKYTCNSTAGSTVAHGLNAAPEFVIARMSSQTASWAVYHKALGASKWLMLNSTNGANASTQEWSGVEPTAGTVTIGNSSANTNAASGASGIMYAFASVEGYSKFGSYEGNGSGADGPFIYTGFRPAFVLIKGDASIDWIIEDASRDPFNQMNKRLYPNDSVAESVSENGNLDFLSNGFKPRTDHISMNNSGTTYVYACFSSNPFKTSRAR